MISPIHWRLALYLLLLGVTQSEAAEGTFRTELRRRPSTGTNQSQVTLTTEAIDPRKTAVVVIDMWDRHWCKTYTARVAGMVPRLNETVAAARKLGMQIVWAPSDVLEFYQGYPQRKAMQAIRSHPPPPALPFNPPQVPQGDYCECGPDQPCKTRAKMWSRQQADLLLAENDLIGDCNNGRELLNLCADRHIDTLLYMGVAANMCVCYRSMGMINMRKHGLRTIFISDLVESIMANGFNPLTRSPDPNFTPAKGTALVQRFLEEHIAPSMASRQLLAAARGVSDRSDARPRVVFVIAHDEYRLQKSLLAFAQAELENEFRCTFVLFNERRSQDGSKLEGLSRLYDADLLVLSVGRRFLTVPQMDRLERFIRAGRPVVAIRASIAAFAEDQNHRRSGDGQVVWQRFDQEVLGCNYTFDDARPPQTGCEVWALPEARRHPLLAGFDGSSFRSATKPYRTRPLASSAAPLLMAREAPGAEPEPVAWVNTHEGGRVFYTSLGHPGDFKSEPFRRLLRNAIHWATDRASD